MTAREILYKHKSNHITYLPKTNKCTEHKIAVALSHSAKSQSPYRGLPGFNAAASTQPHLPDLSIYLLFPLSSSAPLASLPFLKLISFTSDLGPLHPILLHRNPPDIHRASYLAPSDPHSNTTFLGSSSWAPLK